MKRAALLILAIACAFAAVDRDAYRNLYRSWRQAGPTLERDAAAAGPSFGATVDRVANEAAKYAAARRDYLSQAAAQEQQRLKWLEQAPEPEPVIEAGAAQVAVAEIAAVRHSLEVYGNDPDPGIQQARAALARESAALGALQPAVADRQKAADAIASASKAVDQARRDALSRAHDLVSGVNRATEQASQEAKAWAEYYRKISDEARSAGPPPTSATPPLPTSEPPTRQPGVLTTLTLARYIGAWTFPTANGLFHGPQPEFADLVVHEDNGRADGTLFARFKVSSGDPVLRFDFSGVLKNTRTQIFDLKTSDGATGRIELIPGPAFNLLEINFETDPEPGKIHQGNFVLVKK